MRHLVDFRVEKEFKVDVHRFGVYFDIANLFNSNVITGVQTRVPDRAITYSDPTTGLAGELPGQVQVADQRGRPDPDDLRRALELLAM